ncbi:MAG: protein BatD [Gammaproteobacteria bacterium]|nr:protein BatD [Gammaproteobacteria bacterium]
MARRWFGIMLACLLGCAQARADVELTVDPDPPRAGESFNLAFKGSGNDLGEPDFAPLEEQLEILGRNRQTEVQWINGRHSQSTTWMLNVIAKQSGPVRIPAIAFGKQRSPARDLEPAGGGAAAPTQDDDLILESEIEPRSPYVQQQTIYTVRLWHRIVISNAALSEPALGADALVKRLGKDREYQAQRNGKNYEVFERRYAVYPQRSGKLVLAPAALTAQIFRRGNSFFDPFGQSFSTRRLQSSPHLVDVRPVPASYTGKAWLPAKRLSLHDEWAPDNREARVGEPITRTLFLWVDGLTAGQLPTIGGAVPDGVKAYPDQPQSSEQEVPGGYTAVHQEKIALVPGAAGAFTVPELEVPWWNTEADRMEVARLPATELRGTGAAPAPAVPAPEAPAPATAAPSPATAPPARPGPWPWIALVAGSGWAITAALLLRARRPRTSARAAERDPVARDPRTALRDLEKACMAHDAVAAKAALLAWGAQVFAERAASTLGALASCVEGERASAIEELNAALYGCSTSSWNGHRLWRAFADPTASKQREVAPDRDELPPLFPLSG